MGHANRPRFHDALSLDAQPRRVRLPLAGLGQSNANPDADSFTYAYTTKAYSNSRASPDAATSTLDS